MEILSYLFMQRALFASVIIGILCSVIGVYIVLRGMSFIGAGIAHASFGGVALGYVLGVNPIAAALVFAVLTALGIGGIAKKSDIKEDTAVGIFFSATMAFGILCIGLVKNYNVDLMGYLFGSILAVTKQDLYFIVAIFFIVIPIIAIFFKELEFAGFDPEVAHIMGQSVTLLYYLLLALTAITIVASIKIVGIVLVSALIITPAASAYQLSDSFKGMMLIAIILGVLSCVGGLFISYWLNVASGAAIVILSTIIFFITVAFSPKRKIELKRSVNEKI